MGIIVRAIGGPASGRSFTISGPVEIGRGVPDSPQFDDPSISRRHARLALDSSGQLTIEDLGSSNGTLVNGLLTTELTTLAPGDLIDVGDTTLEVTDLTDEPGVAPPADDSTRLRETQPARGETSAGARAESVVRSRSIAAGQPVLTWRALAAPVRLRGGIATAVVLAALWLALYAQLASGNDPGLTKKKTVAIVQPSSSTATSTVTTTTTTTTGSTSSSSTKTSTTKTSSS